MNYKSEWVCEITKGVVLKGVILRGIILRTLLLNKLFLLVVLVSCSEESSRAQLQQSISPPIILANPIVGTAALGLVSDAKVDAYLIATESQAQQHKECSTDSKNKIGSGATDNNGYFNLTLNLDSGYVLFVLSGGSYTEEATNQQVDLTDHQKLYAIHHYHGGETKDQEDLENIIISPWSHLMTGMFCYMTGSRVMSPATSMSNTSAFITNWLGFDPRYVNYKDPTDAKNNRADLTFDEGVKLGFLNSAISELTKEWSATDEVTPHATINSIYLAQLMYKDINNDGSLDGRGAKGPLHIVRKVSNIPLNAATYRLSIPQQMLNFFDSNENNQIKDNGRGILYLLADSINSNKHPQVFQQQKSPPLDMLAPQVEWTAPNTRKLTGIVNISLRVKDFSGVEQVTFYATSSRAASQNREQAIDDTYTFIVDTRPDGSGNFDYHVTTVDILGNEQTINFPVTLINEPPIIEIIAPDINNSGNNASTAATTIKSTYLLEARFSKIIPSQSIADAACSLNDEQNFDAIINKEESIASCAVLLPHNGIHHIEMKLCDDNNLCNTRGHNVLFDDEFPVITPINEQESYQRNVSVSFLISDATSDVVQPVTWTAIGNGETMSGVAQQLSAEGTYQVLFDAARFGNSPVRLTIKARDSLKNMAARSQTYQVFNQPPTLRLTSAPKFNQDIYNAIFEVEENSYTNIRVACRLATSVSFQSGNYQTTQSNNQQSEQTLKSRGECTIVSPNIQDGNHTLEVKICGNYNLCITQPIIITKDTTVPMIRTINLQDEYDGMGGQIILEITDELSRVASATFSIDDSEAQDITKRASDWIFALPLNLNTGKHKLTIIAVDALGNANTIQHDFLTLREEPAIGRVSSLFTKSNLYRLAAQLQPGSYQGDYQAQCILTGQSVVASIASNRINCSLDTQGLNDGEYQVEIILETDYGKSYTREISFIKDTTPPQINILDLLATYTNPVPSTLQVNINDELSPTVMATYRINEGDVMQLADAETRIGVRKIITLPINELPTGRHTLTIMATDSVGNPYAMTSAFIVEKDAPIVTQTSAQATNQGIYNLVATLDKGSYQGDYSAECQINNQVVSATISGNTLKCLLDISSSSDNNYDIRVTLTADYGKSYTRTLTVTKDTVAPIVRITNLQDEYDGAGGQIILEITDELSMVTSATFSIDDNEAQDITKRASDWTFALPLNLNTGKYTLTIVAVDTLGNTNTMQRDFLTLREEPIVSRTSALYTDSNLYRLAAQLDPGSYQGVYEAQCILAEQSVVASISHNRINCPIDTQGLNDGEYQVEITLETDYDKSYTREISFIKDTNPPQISILNLQDEYDGAGGQIILEITDELSMVTSATFSIDDNEAQDITKRASDWTFALPLNLNTGKYTLTIVAVDTLGNTNTMQRDFLTLREEPIVSRTSALYTDSNLYRLAAQLDPGSYQGVYEAQCILAEQSVVASISYNRINCPIDTQGLNDGEYQVEITLETDYDKSYTREISFIKDTTAPQISILNLLSAYTSPIPSTLQIDINDELSPTVMATYRINEGDAMQLADTGARRIITLPINELPTGRHTLTIQATDVVGNSNMMPSNFIVEKDTPIVTQTSAPATNKDIYKLVATLDKGSYQGDYISECQLNNQIAPVVINGNNLKCLLDISSSSDNNHDIRVTLTADYGKSYTRTLAVTKDTTPPQIVAIEHQQAYSDKLFTLRYQVSDMLSDIASVTYLYGDDTQGLNARPIGNNLWEVDINPNLLLSGEHNVRVIVSDALSNSLQINSPILIIKHPPQVTLAHQNVSNKDTLDIHGEIILTSPEASVASITCSFLRNPAGAVTEGINGEINGNNFVCRSLPIVGLNKELVEVEICDIFANCATYPTFVTHDNSPPILSSVAMSNMVNVYSCSEKDSYDNIPPNCSITQSPATNIYSISEQAQDLQKTNPPLIIVQQKATLLNNESVAIDSSTDSIPNNEHTISEIKINRAELDRRGIIFAGINVHDNELSPSRYFTDPYDLNITYSYTQIDCPVDDTGNQNVVCSHNNKKVYFTKIPIPQAAINVNTDSSDAEITIPFSNELLNSANNPLWYSTPPRTIHRLDLFICDEAGNCVQYVTRFRVTVLAATPIVTFNINNSFRNDFRRNDNLRYLFSVIQRNVRTWRVSNPSPTDMWVRIEQSPADIQYLAEMWGMRKINKYSTHRHRQFARRNGQCGSWPNSRTQYRSTIEYTTHTADYYSSTPNPRGPRFAAPDSSSYKLSCGSTGPSVNRVRYEQISGYPRQQLTRESSLDKRINFAITLNHHLVNLAKGTKTPVLEYNNWMLLPAGNSLLLTTDEKMTNDPGYYQPIMIYDNWRNIDRYRSITIPASIGLSYTRSQVENVSPSLSSVRSSIYQIPQVIVNNQRAIHCARVDGEPVC